MNRHLSTNLCFWILLGVMSVCPSPASAQQGQRWALLIGIDGYFDLTPLTSSSSDAVEFGKVLTERCNFDAKHVEVVTDKSGEAGLPGILKLRQSELDSRLEQFIGEAERQDVQTLLIYFSGHGCLAPAASGEQPDDLLLPAIDARVVEGKLKNSISRNRLQDLLAKADIPEKLLILDCCHAARPEQIPLKGKAFRVQLRDSPSGPPTFPQPSLGSEAAPNSTFAILAGSKFGQIASEQVFTKHLIRGLQVTGDTASDADKSSAIELNELFRHVQGTMGREVTQQPAMQLISGKADKIKLAPAIIVPDPPRLTRVQVLSPASQPIPNALVMLVFKDDGDGRLTNLSQATTDRDGMAAIQYQFRDTRDRQGRYQVVVQPPAAGVTPSTTTLTGFADGQSPSLYRVTGYNNPTPTPLLLPKPMQDRQVANKPPASILDRTRLVPKEPTFQETLAAVLQAVKERNDIPDICTFKDLFPAYKRLIDSLGATEKTQIKGMLICFPSEAVWASRPDLRARIIQILRDENVLKPGVIRSRQQYANNPDPSFEQVKTACAAYVRRLEIDVCGLPELVPGYAQLIGELRANEKLELFPGVHVCFPSKATWDNNPRFRREMIDVLRNGFVIDF